MNTLAYKAFADELIQIQLAQLEKGAGLGSLLQKGISSVRKVTTGRAPALAPKASGLGTAPTALDLRKTVAARPGAAGVGRARAKTIDYLPSYPGGAAPRAGGLPRQLRPPREMTPLQAIQQNTAELQKRVTARDVGQRQVAGFVKKGPRPVGKQQLTAASMSPVARTRLRLFQQQAQRVA